MLISFTEEKEKAEQELDKALQQYQMYKDEQFYDQERVGHTKLSSLSNKNNGAPHLYALLSPIYHSL